MILRLPSRSTLSLMAVLLLALVLRLYRLETVPSGFHADEVSFLLNARAIMETGRDEDNRLLPWTLNSYIDPKPALYSYLQIPIVKILGTNPVSARLPSVLLGVLSIYLVYFLLKELRDENLGLLMGLVLALSPWHNMVSRATQEVIMALVFSLLSLIFLIKLVKRWRPWLLIALLFSSYLACYSYHSAKIFLPLTILSWLAIFVYRQKISLIKSGQLLALTVVGAALSFYTAGSQARFNTVGILSNKEPQIFINEQIAGATPYLPAIALRIFYNKPVFYAQSFFKEYLHYFSGDFLFLNQVEPKRYLMPFQGLLYFIDLPLLLLGIYLSIKNKHSLWPFFLSLGLIAPIPAALTYQETPSMIRALPLILSLSFFMAIALEDIWAWSFRGKRLIMVLLIPLLVWQFGYSFNQFFVQEGIYRPWYRNSPYTKIADKLVPVIGNYQKIRVTGDLRPLYAYLALNNLIPISILQAHPLERNQETYNLNQFSFARHQCDYGELDGQTLYIVDMDCVRNYNKAGKFYRLTNVSYNDGVVVYDLVYFKPPTD